VRSCLPRLKPGTVLLREYQGERLTVTKLQTRSDLRPTPWLTRQSGGLYARRIGDGAAYWVFRFCDRFRGGAEREISLGPQAALSLDNARAIAAGLREQIAAGYLPELPDGRRHGRPVDRSRFKR
jgi:hypothetical protein